MHCWAKEIMESLKEKVDEIGIENIDSERLNELETWSRVAKNIVNYEKDYLIIKAMEESGDSAKTVAHATTEIHQII